MQEIGDRQRGDVRERSGCEDDESDDSQSASEQRGRETLLSKGTIQRQEERDPQDHDRKVETVFERAGDPNPREAHRLIWI